MAQTIGFIGLGQMGLPMAANLIRAGYGLRVWNRTGEKAEELIELGAEVAAEPADTAEQGGIVITMLSDDPVLDEVATSGDRLVQRLGAGGIHLSMSTVSPAASRRIAGHHERSGVSYVAAPVFGRPQAAAAGKLWICASGPEKARTAVRPILSAMGQGVFEFGDDPGAANVAKLAGNLLIGAATEALGEAIAFAEKSGVDAGQVIGMMTQTLFACSLYQNYAPVMLERRFDPPGFRMILGLKDLGLILGLARESRVPVPIANLVHDRLLSGIAKGRGELDFTALTLGAAEDAGLGCPDQV